MAFRVLDGKLTYTGTFEESIIEALLKYPELKALVVTRKRLAFDAAISFYVNVNREMKDKYLLASDGLSVTYSNGSSLQFIGQDLLTDGKYSSLESHIILLYGDITDWQTTKLCGSLLSYETKKEKLFPIFYSEKYQLFGDEAKKMALECKKEYEENFVAGRQGRKKTKK